jgi:hypothetical protein
MGGNRIIVRKLLGNWSNSLGGNRKVGNKKAQVFRKFESLWLKASVTKDGEGSLYRVTIQHSEYQVQILSSMNEH